ncbi:MAG: 4Fe-4S dicluster domain-containing protein, partial [Bacteroidales bacterium]
MSFKYFVLPFITGLIILTGFLIYTFIGWIVRIEPSERLKISKNIGTRKTLYAIKEVFMESLLHRKIFLQNPLLGFMHSSLAFGWFLLIVIGGIEVKFYNQWSFEMPYYPVFFRYFEPVPKPFWGDWFFKQAMDALLLIVLTGVCLAFVKRIKSVLFGMKRTTRPRLGDKIALYSLWSIFPLRLFAESVTSGIHQTGGFFTKNFGIFLSEVLPVQYIETPLWWAYSSVLGLFFVVLPFSRYMHIPTEVLLIFLRKYGICTKKYYTGISEVEVYSCSRCGICIDSCQLKEAAIIKSTSVYFIRSIRNNSLNSNILYNCLLCGRCSQVCPVGINVSNLRLAKREEFNLKNKFIYEIEKPQIPYKTDVIYFSGCA